LELNQKEKWNLLRMKGVGDESSEGSVESILPESGHKMQGNGEGTDQVGEVLREN